jgi:two-component system phosphate regulon sensor histidine kinase PhoR
MARRKRLFWQLFIPYLLILLSAVIAILLYSSDLLEGLLLKQTESDLRSQASLFQEQIRGNLSPDEQTDALCKTLGKSVPTRFTVILPNGRVVGDSDENPARMDNHLDRPEIATALTEPFGVSTRFSPTLNKRMMYLAMPFKEGGMLYAIVRVSVPIEEVYSRIKAVQNRILLGGLVVVCLAVIAGFLVYRRVRRPLNRIQEVARAFARGEFQRKLPLSGTEEMAQVAETLNHMASELQQRIGTITTQRNELETVLSSMAEGVFGVDRDERILGMNQAAGRILGCDPALSGFRQEGARRRRIAEGECPHPHIRGEGERTECPWHAFARRG